jgi:hypothetical protein
MNSFTLILLCLIGSMSAFIVENETKQPHLMGIIEAILNDPEFVSLKPQQQLRVLVTIYEMLETYLKSRQFYKRYDANQSTE